MDIICSAAEPADRNAVSAFFYRLREAADFLRVTVKQVNRGFSCNLGIQRKVSASKLQRGQD